MIRIECFYVVTLLLVCGCTSGSSTSSLEQAGQSPSNETSVALSDPDLETVPEQTEPSEETMKPGIFLASDQQQAEQVGIASGETMNLGIFSLSSLGHDSLGVCNSLPPKQNYNWTSDELFYTTTFSSAPGGDDNLHGASAFAALVKAAAAKDGAGWSKAEKELQELGASATDALAMGLTDKNRVARELAAMFLAQLGSDSESAAPALLKVLDDESTFARVNAAAALSNVEDYAAKMAPVLKGLLTDEDANVRQTAAIALRNVGAAAATAIADLTRTLGDANPDVRIAAAGTLGELGATARKSLPALRRLAMDQDREVSTTASRAIAQIEEATSEVVPASATE